MKVENVYQDNEGKWHIDYSMSHLMGLAIRVYFGQILIGLIALVPIVIISVLAGLALGESLPQNEDAASSSDVQHKSICNRVLEDAK